MKKKDFLKLIKDVPMDGELAYATEGEYGETNFDTEFRLFKFIESATGRAIWTVNCGKLSINGLETPEHYTWAQTVKEFRAKFPNRKNWSVEGAHSSLAFTVKYDVGGFKCYFQLSLRVKDMTLESRFHMDKLQKVDSWDDFFAKAVPCVKKALQKQRETLEELLDAPDDI